MTAGPGDPARVAGAGPGRADVDDDGALPLVHQAAQVVDGDARHPQHLVEPLPLPPLQGDEDRQRAAEQDERAASERGQERRGRGRSHRGRARRRGSRRRPRAARRPRRRAGRSAAARRWPPPSAARPSRSPGMNFATRSDGSPQRSKTDSVCRTQESGESEILQSVFRIRLPRAASERVPDDVGDERGGHRDREDLPRGKVPFDRERARDDQHGDRRDWRAELLEQHDPEDQREAVGDDVLRSAAPWVADHSRADLALPLGPRLRGCPEAQRPQALRYGRHVDRHRPRGPPGRGRGRPPADRQPGRRLRAGDRGDRHLGRAASA